MCIRDRHCITSNTLHCTTIQTYIATIHACMHTHAYMHTIHDMTLHCITLHRVALHCIASHCLALHCIALHYIALHYVTLQYAYTCMHAYNTERERETDQAPKLPRGAGKEGLSCSCAKLLLFFRFVCDKKTPANESAPQRNHIISRCGNW